jgi:hypothetical protein
MRGDFLRVDGLPADAPGAFCDVVDGYESNIAQARVDGFDDIGQFRQQGRFLAEAAFSRAFSKLVGVPPAAWRKSERATAPSRAEMPR